VTANQFIVVRELPHKCRYRSRLIAVANRHGNITDKPSSLSAKNRTVSEVGTELHIGHAKELDEPRMCIPATRNEFVHLWPFMGEPVPGTNILAVIAAVNSVADRPPKLSWNWTAVLNREIRDAPSRVKNIWPDDGIGRTSLDT
ncbi:uncharacterized protein METZ01_LOCUS35560, partial [marine metagenome]